MSVNTYAELYVGAELNLTQVMEMFGPKYDLKIRTACPEDNVPNPRGENFCSNCGSNLKYKEKVSNGIGGLYEVEELAVVRQLGLDVCILGEESVGRDGLIIGRRIAETSDISCGGSVIPLEVNIADTIKEIQGKLPQLGLNQTVSMYLITRATD